MSELIQIKDVSKEYVRGTETVKALRDVSLSIQAGEFVAITGESGSGKTTLLQLLGCMDTPTRGSIRITGQETSGLSDTKLSEFRSKTVGFIFQQFLLLPTLTALENVEMPAFFGRSSEGQDRARELLELVGLGGRMTHYPNELSGGEMQRVAIARALVNRPKILLADEPTGNLDSKNADSIMRVFEELNAKGQTILMVTHSRELAGKAKRRISMRDGQAHDG
ncbi:MAG: ABC transporter ATP-binding protein [Bdellovibrionales bacterium]